MEAVEERLAGVLGEARDPCVREIVDFLLEAPGKRIRPALVVLSAEAASASRADGFGESERVWVDVATAVELIHMASLVHDDLIDAATVRHHRSSINARWGGPVSIALGDYLCSKAFQLATACENPRLLAVLGSGLSAMCEGELVQVYGRRDLDVSESDCLAVAEKKTAALFGACCGVGAVAADADPMTRSALQQFGLHIGIAFQILDDCRDLLSDQQRLGKRPAQDLLAGDATLPVVHLLGYCRREGLEGTGSGGFTLEGIDLARIRELFHLSGGDARIRRLVGSHLSRAKQQLQRLAVSDFAQALARFADCIGATVSMILAR
ncbi:MAG: polyprenyl synthetase family protein [Sedimentisphaerales bacterium]|nr:polyprenyl synthetase family protein [Sedimentisphaerales bacterium]